MPSTCSSCIVWLCFLALVLGEPADRSALEDCSSGSPVSLLQTSFELSRPQAQAPGLAAVESLNKTELATARKKSDLAPREKSSATWGEYWLLQVPTWISASPDGGVLATLASPQHAWLNLAIAVTLIVGLIFGMVQSSRNDMSSHLWDELVRRISEYVMPLATGIVYIIWSGVLVFANKHLASGDNFPHPVSLVALHMTTSALISHVILWVSSKMSCPEAAPEETCPVDHGWTRLPWVDSLAHMKQVRAAGPEACARLAPVVFLIAVLTACVLALENAALQFSTVAFLQLMKDFGLVYVAALSALLGLDLLNGHRWTMIALIIAGGGLCVQGEVQFALKGFLIQMFSSLLGAVRIVTQGKVLADKKLSLGPISYSALVAPACAIVLIPAAVLEASLSTHSVLEAFQTHRVFIALNCVLAGGFNLVLAATIKYFGPIGFALAGTVKNAVIVVYSMFLLGVPTSAVQIVGCVLIFVCVPAYSMMGKGQTADAKGQPADVKDQPANAKS